jgi:hypothetical protein
MTLVLDVAGGWEASAFVLFLAGVFYLVLDD